MVTKRLLAITTGGSMAVTGDLGTLLENALTNGGKPWGIDATLDTVKVDNVDSSNVTPEHWERIIEEIARNYDSYDGFLVTQRIKTMGYTCSALSFALPNLGKPVIVTGSQIPHGRPGSDAKWNLENAVRIAIIPDEGGVHGVVGVVGSRIIPGTRVTNPSDFYLNAFERSPEEMLGKIGIRIELDPIALARYHAYLGSKGNPAAVTRADLVVKSKFDPRILSFAELPGVDPKILIASLRGLLETDEPLIKSVIFRALDSDDVNPRLDPYFEYLKEKEIPVVVTPQISHDNSGFRVGEPGARLARAGLAIPTHDMPMETTTAKMMWLRGQGVSYSDFGARMLENVCGEISVPPVLREPGAAPQAWRRPAGVPDPTETHPGLRRPRGTQR